MTIERTLVVVKPDGVKMRFVEKILERYQKNDLSLVGQVKYLTLTEAEAGAFYAEHRGKFYFEATVLAMMSGLLAAFLLEGENAISRVREMNGATDPNKAVPGTIRHDFRSAGGPFNTVHSSDSYENVVREGLILFRYPDDA